uniref:Immunoglobulin V-set domain-containing protein n=1 Tax=Varanus komodoensis TaxID=61221 RepID=A0A8D2L8U9_VARKO
MGLPWIFQSCDGLPVTQPDDKVTVVEGKPILINCTYDSSVDYLFWYILLPGQTPRLFLRHLGDDPSDEGRIRDFSATKDAKHKSFNMEKAGSRLDDTAIYFCAGSNTVRQARREGKQKHAREQYRLLQPRSQYIQ